MQSFTIRKDLGWLPNAEGDFNALLEELTSDSKAEDFRALANIAKTQTQLDKLAVHKRKLFNTISLSEANFTSLTLAVIGNKTTSHLPLAIEASALRNRIWCDVLDTEYDSAGQINYRDPSEIFGNVRPDLTLIAIDEDGLPLTQCLDNEQEATNQVNQCVDALIGIAEKISAWSQTPCILQTIAVRPETALTTFDCQLAGSKQQLISNINQQLRERVKDTPHVLFDAAQLADEIGTSNWHSPVYRHMAKLPFDPAFLPFYAARLIGLIAAMRGQAKKVLILDCDNTLWGGVVGDDGIENLKIGQGSLTGEAFLAIQSYAIRLRERGVILAVCSKNTDEVARDVFISHPDMLLREEHIAVFRINWEDKASNIKMISKILDVGSDSLVFLDDNPAERARIRQMLPEVEVPEIGDDPAFYPQMLDSAAYFETISFNDEDRKRADMYTANARRNMEMDLIGDYDDYLSSLDMKASLKPFDKIGRKRIAQLVGKTNQFNLTTRRYSELDIEKMEHDPSIYTLQVRLSDKFGDNGMISVVIVRKQNPIWIIDTWLMSCRVLKRRVEELVLQNLVASAKQDGATELCGEYIATPRNIIVADHYKNLGFIQSADETDNIQSWTLDLSSYQANDLPFDTIAD